MSTTQKQTVPFVVSGSGDGVLQRIEVGEGGAAHVFSTDTVPPFGGDDSQPSPLSYVLGALTGCNQITAQLVANDLGITLGRFSADAVGDFDPAVLATGAEGDPNFDAIRVGIRVQTDADDATFDRLRTETERRCPVTQLAIRSGLDFTSTWTREPLEA